VEETIQKYVLFFSNVFYLLDNYITSFELAYLSKEYDGNLIHQLMNISKELINGVKNTAILNPTLDSCIIKEEEKVYFVYGHNTNKTDLKLLAKHLKFIIVDNIEDAKYIIIPYYKSINKYNNYFYIRQTLYRKSDDKPATWKDKSEECYTKTLIHQEFKNVNIDILFHLEDKIIISDLYISKLVYLLKNPKKESVEDFNFDAIKELLMSSDLINVEIAINILKGKNIEPFAFDILMIYYLNNDLQIKTKIKSNLLSKIPFLHNIDNPSTATLNYIIKLKDLIKLFETNKVPYSLDFLISVIKNAKPRSTLNYKIYNWINSYYDNKDLYNFNQITSMVHKLKAIGVELTDDQIKQLINL
jgi:hypothetical protein